MKLLQPAALSGEILTLLDEADNRLIIVSPYVKIDKWFKLKKKLESAIKRNIQIEFYIREDNNSFESFEQVRILGIQPIGIPDLHTKLYMNEKNAIVTSMNLLLNSDTNSLDIGYKTETEKEYAELLEYYNRYIKKNQTAVNQVQSLDWRDQLHNTLAKNFGDVSMNGQNNTLHIQTRRNKYDCFIAYEYGKNLLRMTGILSNAEFVKTKTQLQQINTRLGLKLELIAGNKGYYDSIWGTLATDLKSISIDDLLFPEQELAASSIIKFVSEVERIKSMQ